MTIPPETMCVFEWIEMGAAAWLAGISVLAAVHSIVSAFRKRAVPDEEAGHQVQVEVDPR